MSIGERIKAAREKLNSLTPEVLRRDIKLPGGGAGRRSSQATKEGGAQESTKHGARDTKESDGLSSQLDRLRASIRDYYAVLRERLAPLINYYNGLNPREKLLSKLAGIFVLGYALFYLVFTPYMAYRTAVVAARDSAYEEFVWLSSQRERVSSIIESRGGDFNQIFNINDMVAQHAPEAQVEQLADGEYVVTMTAAQGTAFFNLIHAVINRGGELESVELIRGQRAAEGNYEARLKI